MRRRILGLFTALCLLTNLIIGMTAFSTEPEPGAEPEERTGTVHADKLYVRETPGGTVVGELYDYDIVDILGEAKAANGDVWYLISKGSVKGYSHSAYITVNPVYKYEYNEEFEAHLEEQGFPEDYKKALRKIYAQYPTWVFEARHLSMTWEEAFAAESAVGLNTITKPDAWKSMEYGAYNWDNQQYVEFDSGGWVAASPRLIAYYMDPRNFLNASDVFQFEKLTYSDKHTLDGVRAILPDALDEHAEDLMKAAEETNVSAYFLAARMRQEGSHLNGLGTGTVEDYEGYYNFFHFGAWAHSNNSAVTNGAIYAQKMGWDTPYKCIKDSADNLARGYIKLGQDTTYFQKFNMTNTTSGLYNHQYMSNTAAAASEGRIRRGNATEDDLKSTLVFSIPVYKDMPTTVAPQPTANGNNNNFLSSLSIEGTSLTPSFNRYTYDYAAHVGAVNEITITAIKSDDNATVTGAGTIKLEAGTTIIPITVTATSGETRTYTLTVTCDGTPPPEPPKNPTITGTTYTVGDTITKVEPETTVADFLAALQVQDGSAVLIGTDDAVKTDGIVATGDIVSLKKTDGTMHDVTYPVIIYGDVNGDGKVTSYDLRVAQKHILNITHINGYYLTAADSSKDGKVTSYDLRVTQKFILKFSSSIQ